MSIHQDLRPYVPYDNPTTFENLIRALERRGITDIDQLNGLTEADLLDIKGVGEKSVGYIRLAIACKHDDLAAARHRLSNFQAMKAHAQQQIVKLEERIAHFDLAIHSLNTKIEELKHGPQA